MDIELTGKKAIVTGGSRGIAKAIAREGVDVAIAARDASTLEEAAKEMGAETKRRVIPIVADTMRWEDV